MTPDVKTAEQTFRSEGVCLLRGALDEEQLALARSCFDWSIAHPSDNANQFESTPEQPGRFYADINNPRLLDPESPYPGFLARSSIASRLSELWGGSDIWFLYEQVLLKEGAEARRTPWHQDSSYLPIAGDMLAIVWITLEPTSRECSLEFVAGSHRGPLYDGSTFAPGDDTQPLYGDGTMPRLPDIEADRGRWPVRGWEIAPGDILVFHPATLHGGAPTRAGARRRTVSLRFFGEDAIYRPLPSDGVESIGIEGETIWKRLRHELAAGDPLHKGGLLKLRTGRVSA